MAVVCKLFPNILLCELFLITLQWKSKMETVWYRSSIIKLFAFYKTNEILILSLLWQELYGLSYFQGILTSLWRSSSMRQQYNREMAIHYDRKMRFNIAFWHETFQCALTLTWDMYKNFFHHKHAWYSNLDMHVTHFIVLCQKFELKFNLPLMK